MIDIYAADEILKIRFWDEIFSKEEAAAKRDYRMLCKIWHPDKNSDPKANDVFAHLTSLYNQVGTKTNLNPVVSFKERDNAFSIPYFFSDTFEMGSVYFDTTRTIFIYDQPYDKYVSNGLKNLCFITTKIANEEKLRNANRGSITMPDAIYTTEDGKRILVYNRTGKIYRLADILSLRKEIDQKHVAWIISRLNNLVCLLNASGYSHNGLTLSNCFADVENHKILLYGGWEYSLKLGEAFDTVCAEIFSIVPQSVKVSKKASSLTDTESVKAIGRNLTRGQKLPVPYKEWIWSDNDKSPMKEFGKWDAALNSSYPKREFVKLDIRDEEVFKR